MVASIYCNLAIDAPLICSKSIASLILSIVNLNLNNKNLTKSLENFLEYCRQTSYKLGAVALKIKTYDSRVGHALQNYVWQPGTETSAVLVNALNALKENRSGTEGLENLVNTLKTAVNARKAGEEMVKTQLAGILPNKEDGVKKKVQKKVVGQAKASSLKKMVAVAMSQLEPLNREVMETAQLYLGGSESSTARVPHTSGKREGFLVVALRVCNEGVTVRFL